MRRFICLMLAAILIFLLPGCKEEEPEFIKPAQFYYLNADVLAEDIGYGDTYEIFLSETRETEHINDNLVAFLNDYLQGPITPVLYLTIPSDAKLVDAQMFEHGIHIIFSEEFSKLSGIDLTLACTYLSITLFEYFDVDYVEIRAEGVRLEGKESITISLDSLYLKDSFPEPTIVS